MSIILVWRFRTVCQTGEPTGVPQRTVRRLLGECSLTFTLTVCSKVLHQIYVPIFSTANKIVAQTC